MRNKFEEPAGTGNPDVAVGRRGPVMGLSFHIAPKEAQRKNRCLECSGAGGWWDRLRRRERERRAGCADGRSGLGKVGGEAWGFPCLWGGGMDQREPPKFNTAGPGGENTVQVFSFFLLLRDNQPSDPFTPPSNASSGSNKTSPRPQIPDSSGLKGWNGEAAPRKPFLPQRALNFQWTAKGIFITQLLSLPKCLLPSANF